MAVPKWEPPADPDLRALAGTAWENWQLDKPKVLAFDTETTGLEYHDTAFCATLAWVHDDVVTGRKEVVGHYFDFERVPQTREAVQTIIGYADTLVAHNAKFDVHKLEAQGIVIRPDQVLHDTECMAHLDDEHRDKGLKDLAVSVLHFNDTIQVPGKAKNKETGKMEDVVRLKPRSAVDLAKAKDWAKKHHGLRSVKEVGYHLLPRGVLVPYAILDAVWTFNLARELLPRVLRYPDLTELYWRELELSRGAIYEMEKAGMGTRPEYVAAQIGVYAQRCTVHELGIEQTVGKPVRSGKIPPKERADYFNPSASSPDAAAFFEATGNGRDNYDAEALATIDHPLATKLLAYRKDKKILDSYFIALQKATGADGVYHQSLRQHGTVSGRTSGGKERGDQ